MLSVNLMKYNFMKQIMSDSDRLKDVVQARKKEMENTRKRREENKIRLREQREEAERQKFLAFSEHILPLVINHFAHTHHSLSISAVHPKIIPDGTTKKPSRFEILDKQEGEWDVFYLEGDLKELGIGEGESIILKKILDNKLKEILQTDLEDHESIDWVTPNIYEDWVFFHGRKPTIYFAASPSGRRGRAPIVHPFHRVVIARLEDGELKFKFEFESKKGILFDGGSYHTVYPELSEVSNFNRMDMWEWRGIKTIGLVLEDGEIIRLFHVFNNEIRPFEPRINFYPNLDDVTHLTKLKELFEEYGLEVEKIDKDSFKLSIAV